MKYFLFFFLFSISLFSQHTCKKFPDKLIFKIQSEIQNESEFENSFSTFSATIDSALIKLYGKNEMSSLNRPTLRLQYDPRQNNNIIPVKFEYEYNKTFIKSTVYRTGRVTGNIKIINPKNATYKLISPRDSAIVKQNLKYNFKNINAVEIDVFKDSTKNILGYKCFKIIIKERENGSYNKIAFSDLFSKAYIYTEMYVTKKIKSLYHPLVSDKNILNKYYPLEIKKYSDILKGYSVIMTTKDNMQDH